MADDDIYGNKKRYETFVRNLASITAKPTSERNKYYCKNSDNKKYFDKLIIHFNVKDLSYIRRLKLLYLLKRITYITEKELATCTRDDINEIVAYFHTTHKTVESKRDFIKDLKCIWRVLFPEKDQQGRVDETITPYVIRHLSRRIDKSKQKRRNDKLTWNEFQRIVRFFEKDPQIQAYLMLAVESLGRPQEILYTKIRDYNFYDNYAKIWISEHGKEGTGFLQCIDSYAYVMRWFTLHPFKDDPGAYFFINRGNRGLYKQLKPLNLNKRLRHALAVLKIPKRVTCYSFKRNGVTFSREKGESDAEIQHKARWTTTKQLHTYDLTTHEDAFKSRLRKRGLLGSATKVESEAKVCGFCSHNNGFAADFCANCKRPLDRHKITEMQQLTEQLASNELVHRFAKLEQMFTAMMEAQK